MSKVNVLSGLTVTRTGSGVPVLMCCVLALNSYEPSANIQPGRKTENASNLAEVHSLDSFASQRWADGRTRTCLTGSDNELHDLVHHRTTTGLGHLDALRITPLSVL
jgi:hypothetical protein